MGGGPRPGGDLPEKTQHALGVPGSEQAPRPQEAGAQVPQARSLEQRGRRPEEQHPAPQGHQGGGGVPHRLEEGSRPLGRRRGRGLPGRQGLAQPRQHPQQQGGARHREEQGPAQGGVPQQAAPHIGDQEGRPRVDAEPQSPGGLALGEPPLGQQQGDPPGPGGVAPQKPQKHRAPAAGGEPEPPPQQGSEQPPQGVPGGGAGQEACQHQKGKERGHQPLQAGKEARPDLGCHPLGPEQQAPCPQDRCQGQQPGTPPTSHRKPPFPFLKFTRGGRPV